MKKLLILVFTLVCGISYSQDKIRKLTFSIVDTSSSKLEQTTQIYKWITHHISYDIKNYLRNTSIAQTSTETLKRRKGVCMDYAQLFKDMCESAGIECYIVFGYSKGFDYEKGDLLLRADHCWNVVHIDTTWINIDATWGSGSIEQKPTWQEPLKKVLFRIPPVYQKSVFVKNPNEEYFNFFYNKPQPSHLPLDPKWQLVNFPITIREFEADSFVVIKRASFYNIYELEMVKQVPLSRQLFLEGMNGKSFNPANNYDIALGYFFENLDFNYKTWMVKPENLSETMLRVKNYAQSYQSILLYRQAVDSFIRGKTKKLNSIQNLNKRLKQSIKTTSKNSRKRLDKKIEGIFKRENALYRKIEAYEFRIRNIRKTNLNNIQKLAHKPEFFYYEPIQYVRIRADIENVDTRCDSLNGALTGLIQQSRELLEKDFKLINHIYNSLEEFHFMLQNYKSVIAHKDNREIISYFNQLDSAYKSIQTMMRDKQRNLSLFNRTITQCVAHTREMVWELETGMSMVKNYYKVSRNDSAAQNLFERLKMIIESKYVTSIDLTNLSLAINSSQTDYHENFNTQINALKKTSRIILSYLANYLNYSILKQERILSRETAMSKSIEKVSKAGMKNLHVKLDEFQKKYKTGS